MRLTVPSGTLDLDLDQVDLFDPHLYADGDPHPIWALMRERAPVHHQVLPDGREFWSVTTYEDAKRVLADHEAFTSERGTLLVALDAGDPAGGKMMAATDPPRHTALRIPLTRAMSPREWARRESQLRASVRAMLAPAYDDDHWDLAVAAAEFPMTFTGALMGLPERDWPRLTHCTTAAIAADDEAFQEGDSLTTLVSVHHELFEYFSEQVRERSASEPRGDLIDVLMTMWADGAPLDHEELVYNCYSLLLGANVTTPHVLSATVMELMDRPAEYRRLADRPALVNRAVEEGLRWASPANHFMRYSRRGVELGGQVIPAGSAVAVWLGSANRDEKAFADPYRFDIARAPNRHLAFGFGPHYCVGASLARVALRMALTEIVGMFDRIEPDGEVRHLHSNFTAGITRLPLRTTMRRAPVAPERR